MRKLKKRIAGIPITVKASSAYAICSIIQKGLAFITLPLFARLLTTEEYGQSTIYGSWTGILSIFLTLNLAYGSFSPAMMRFENDRDGYISSIEGICVSLSAIFLLIYLPFQNLWNRLFELPTLLVCVMIVELLCTTAVQLWSGRKRFEFKYKSVVVVTLLTAVLAPLVSYLFIKVSDNKGDAKILGTALVNVIIGGSIFILNAGRGKKIFNKEYWKYALSFNIPLLAYYLSQVIFNQSDRIMISHMIGKGEAAQYSVAYTLGTVLTFVLNAINNSYVPWLYGKIKEGKQGENRSISIGIALLMALLLTAVIWYAPEIIRIMAGEKYIDAIPVVAPVALSILLLFYAQLFVNVEFYYEEKKKLVWASIGAAAVNLVLNWVFIQWFGFVAAAYTTLASYIIFAIANQRAMKKILAERGINDTAYDYKWLIIIFAAMSVITVIGMLLYKTLVLRILITIVALGLIAYKRSYFLRLFMKLKK